MSRQLTGNHVPQFLWWGTWKNFILNIKVIYIYLKGRKTKLKNSNVKHVKMGGPRAKSLEYLLRNRKENKLTKVGVSQMV